MLGGSGRAVGAGVGTAAGDAGVQFMNIGSGSGAEFNSFRTAMAGAFGAGGEVVVSGLGRILSSIVHLDHGKSLGREKACELIVRRILSRQHPIDWFP